MNLVDSSLDAVALAALSGLSQRRFKSFPRKGMSITEVLRVPIDTPAKLSRVVRSVASVELRGADGEPVLLEEMIPKVFRLKLPLGETLVMLHISFVVTVEDQSFTGCLTCHVGGTTIEVKNLS